VIENNCGKLQKKLQHSQTRIQKLEDDIQQYQQNFNQISQRNDFLKQLILI
jgi:prefoldin subunit 5